jgi:lysozyme family protein
VSAFGACLPIVLSYEGGFINDARDPGGATNFGITIATLQAWRRKPTLVDDVAALTRDEAASIYRQDYWDKIRGDELPLPIALVTLDAAVNCGPPRAAHWLQAAAGALQDGVIGDATLKAVRATVSANGAMAVAKDELVRRLTYMAGLATWRIYGNGWGHRLVDLATKAAVL